MREHSHLSHVSIIDFLQGMGFAFHAGWWATGEGGGAPGTPHLAEAWRASAQSASGVGYPPVRWVPPFLVTQFGP